MSPWEHQINNKCHIYTSPFHICWQHWSIPMIFSSWVQMQPWSLWLPPPILPSPAINWGPQMCQALFRVLWNTQCIGYKAKSLSCFQSMGVGRRNEAHLPLAFSWSNQNKGHVWDASSSGVNIAFLISLTVLSSPIHTPGLTLQGLLTLWIPVTRVRPHIYCLGF